MEDVRRLYADVTPVYIRNMSMWILVSTGSLGTNFLQIAWDSCITSLQTQPLKTVHVYYLTEFESQESGHSLESSENL